MWKTHLISIIGPWEHDPPIPIQGYARSIHRMIRNLLLPVVLLPLIGHAQGFNKRYDAFDWHYNQIAADVELSDGRYVMISLSFDQDTLGPDSFLVHGSLLTTALDLEGNKLQEHRVFRHGQGTSPGWADCCDTVPGGGFVVPGTLQSLDQVFELCLFRLSTLGDTIWTASYGHLNEHWIGQQVKKVEGKGYLLVGYTDHTGYQDGFALMTDTSGSEVWRQTYGGPDADGLQTSSPAPDGGFFLGGGKTVSGSSNQFWLIRIDSLGEQVWEKVWGSSHKDSDAETILCSSGDLLSCGARGHSSVPQTTRLYLCKRSPEAGDLVWEHEYGEVADSPVLFSVKECHDESIIACGRSMHPGGTGGVLLHTSPAGDSLWMRTYHFQDSVITSAHGEFYDVLPTADGGYIAVGSVYDPFPQGYHYSQDTWAVKVDGFGCIVPGCQLLDGVTETVTNLTDALTLYPNPVANGQVLQVRVDLPVSFHPNGPLVLSITAPDGKLVKQQLVASSSDLEQISLAGLHPGTYALHLSDAHTWIAGKKFVVY